MKAQFRKGGPIQIERHVAFGPRGPSKQAGPYGIVTHIGRTPGGMWNWPGSQPRGLCRGAGPVSGWWRSGTGARPPKTARISVFVEDTLSWFLRGPGRWADPARALWCVGPEVDGVAQTVSVARALAPHGAHRVSRGPSTGGDVLAGRQHWLRSAAAGTEPTARASARLAHAARAAGWAATVIGVPLGGKRLLQPESPRLTSAGPDGTFLLLPEILGAGRAVPGGAPRSPRRAGY